MCLQVNNICDQCTSSDTPANRAEQQGDVTKYNCCLGCGISTGSWCCSWGEGWSLMFEAWVQGLRILHCKNSHFSVTCRKCRVIWQIQDPKDEGINVPIWVIILQLETLTGDPESLGALSVGHRRTGPCGSPVHMKQSLAALSSQLRQYRSSVSGLSLQPFSP